MVVEIKIMRCCACFDVVGVAVVVALWRVHCKGCLGGGCVCEGQSLKHQSVRPPEACGMRECGLGR